jgi:transcription initiation factor TFIIE subunit beta
MDPSLLKEREAFKKRAMANPVIEKKRKESAEKPRDGESSKKKMKKEPSSSAGRASGSRDKASTSTLSKDPFAYKAMTGTSQYNFAVLAKIVKYMKTRYQEDDKEPLTLDEILDETNQLDIGPRQRHWLENEALKSNPKVEVTEDGKYKFKPTFQLKDRKSLLRLLDKYDQRRMGGIHLEDIQESLPNADKAIRLLGDSVITITRPIDKKKILFYNDKSIQFSVDDDFQKLWRSVAVDGIDEGKIEEYLQKQGITSMQDLGGKGSKPIQKRKKTTSKRQRVFKKLNDHVADILQDYTDKS